MYQLLIKNAQIADGTGAKLRQLDVAVEDGRIVAVQPNIETAAKQLVDGDGLILAPGFIDIQNHSDTYWQLFANPNLHSLISQGYTSIVVGNSGTSLSPLLSEESFRSVQKWQSTSGLNVNWRSFAEYQSQLKALKFGSNVTSLVGYSTIRRGLLGDSLKPPNKAELDTLLNMITQAFIEGAAGLSVGLQYSHELNVTDLELVALAKLCAAHNKLLSVGLRNEDSELISSVREITSLAEQTGVNLKISHLKIRHASNWPALTELLDTIESAYHRGTKIHFDCYPYTHTWQPLYTYLPSWAQEGGRSHLLERIKNQEQRKKILSALTNLPAKLPQLVIASSGSNLKVTGKKISTLAKNWNLTSEETILHLIEHGGSATLVFDECMDSGVVNILSNHSLALIATNGGGFYLVYENKIVHPRCFGTSAKYLRQVI
ncbi:MAG TPA: hypothetical protein PKD79_00690, partial [Candidatus Doudnabacteria bacterium]|nr:hypothetical protein [Candidatus Doudnabacteria bacterium]